MGRHVECSVPPPNQLDVPGFVVPLDGSACACAQQIESVDAPGMEDQQGLRDFDVARHPHGV